MLPGMVTCVSPWQLLNAYSGILLIPVGITIPVSEMQYANALSPIDVTLSGLSQDFKGEPFGSMPKLLAIAQKTTSLTAICVMDTGDGHVCRKPAYFTQRLVNGVPASYNSPIILVGGADSYTPRCEEHWEVPERPIDNLE